MYIPYDVCVCVCVCEDEGGGVLTVNGKGCTCYGSVVGCGSVLYGRTGRLHWLQASLPAKCTVYDPYQENSLTGQTGLQGY